MDTEPMRLADAIGDEISKPSYRYEQLLSEDSDLPSRRKRWMDTGLHTKLHDRFVLDLFAWTNIHVVLHNRVYMSMLSIEVRE